MFEVHLLDLDGSARSFKADVVKGAVALVNASWRRGAPHALYCVPCDLPKCCFLSSLVMHALALCSAAQQHFTGRSSVRLSQPSLGRQDSDQRLVGVCTSGTPRLKTSPHCSWCLLIAEIATYAGEPASLFS